MLPSPISTASTHISHGWTKQTPLHADRPLFFQQFDWRRLLVMLSAVLWLGWSADGWAQSEDGKKLYQLRGCVSCHGPDGNLALTPEYPILAGQNAPYTVAQLKAYKTQARKGGQAALMWGMASQLNDAEMKAIAEYLASVKRR